MSAMSADAGAARAAAGAHHFVPPPPAPIAGGGSVGGGGGGGGGGPGHAPAAAPCRLADVPGVARGLAKLSPAGVVLLSRVCGCPGSADLGRARQVVLDFRGWACDPAAAQANKWASQTRTTKEKRLMRYMRSDLAEPLTVLGLSTIGTKQVLVERLLDFAEDPFAMLMTARACMPPDLVRHGADSLESGSVAAATGRGGVARVTLAPSWAPGQNPRRPLPPLRSLSEGAATAAAAASPYCSSTAYSPSIGSGGLDGLGRPPGLSGAATSSLPPLRWPASGSAAVALRRPKPKSKRARHSYVEDPYMTGESPFHMPLDRPLGEPVVLIGSEFSKSFPQLPSHLFPTPPSADMTIPGAAAGEVQVHLRCLRVEYGRPSSSWKQEWPFPVMARINGRLVNVPQARRQLNGKALGPDVGMDITPYLALPRQPKVTGSSSVPVSRAVVPENRVSLLRDNMGPETDPPPGIFVLFAQRVRVATDTFFVQRVEVQTAAHVERLRVRYGMPATRADGSATTPLDVAVADAAKFMGGGDIQIEFAKVSLRCPLSMGRLTIPVKGMDCKHLQCFDLVMFLAYARRSRQFACPVCNRQTASLERLWVSPLLSEALRLCPVEDDVEVLSDGSLRPPASSVAAAASAEAVKAKSSRVHTYGLDDSDGDDGVRMRSSPAGVQAGKSSPATAHPEAVPIGWDDAMVFLASGGEGADGGAAGEGTTMADTNLPSGLCTPSAGFLPSVISTPPAAVSPLPPPAAAPRPPPGVAFVDLTGDSDEEEATAAAPVPAGTPVSQPPSSGFLSHPLPSPPAPPQGDGRLLGSGLRQLQGPYLPCGGDDGASGDGLRQLTTDGGMHEARFGGGDGGSCLDGGYVSGGPGMPPLPPFVGAAALVSSGTGGVRSLPRLLPGATSVGAGDGGGPQPLRPPEEPAFSLAGSTPLLSTLLSPQSQARGGHHPPPQLLSSPGLELPIGTPGLSGVAAGPEGLAAARP